ncbi:MAG: hypothetical protein WCY43_01110 [Patescibacteria group bacterium]|nr:hypothetical protein [Patescibacteria group bacterium]
MENLNVFLALGAIGFSSGFLTSFLIEHLLPLISINLTKKGDNALVIAIIITSIARISLGSGFGLKFIATIGVTTLIGYYLFFLLKK